MLSWLVNRQQTSRLVQADAQILVRDLGAEAYYEARLRERDPILSDGTTHQSRTPEHWRRVALLVAKLTGKEVGLDTATRMARDPISDSNRDEGTAPESEALRIYTGE